MKIMTVAVKCIKALKKIIQNIMFKKRLLEMDRMWRLLGGGCWQLFPPSVYYTHTEEEIEQKRREIKDSCLKLLEEYANSSSTKEE